MTGVEEQPAPAVLPQPGHPSVRRRVVLAWGLYDWGSSAYNSVITTFVFGARERTVSATSPASTQPYFTA